MKDLISSFHAPAAYTRLSRRAFVGMAALTALAGCAPAPFLGGSGATPVATHPPTPIPPSGTISAANASAIKQLTSFTPSAHSVRGVAWSRDGRLLAAGAGNDIYLWDMTEKGFSPPQAASLSGVR